VNGSPDFVVLQSILPERILQYPFGGEFLRSLLKQSSFYSFLLFDNDILRFWVYSVNIFGNHKIE